jgi:hypothetical protein
VLRWHPEEIQGFPLPPSPRLLGLRQAQGVGHKQHALVGDRHQAAAIDLE